MSLQDMLDDYEVTEVPAPAPQRLSWLPSEAAASGGVGGGDGVEAGTLAVLDSYRITRVPAPAAG